MWANVLLYRMRKERTLLTYAREDIGDNETGLNFELM
jgi:hypothetical protein